MSETKTDAINGGPTWMAGDYTVNGQPLRVVMPALRDEARAFAGTIIAARAGETLPVPCGMVIAGDLLPQTLPSGQIVLGAVTGCEHAMTTVSELVSTYPDWPVGEALATLWLALRTLRNEPRVPGQLVPKGHASAN